MNEVPLYVPQVTCDGRDLQVQGYLAHQKTPTPLGPPWDPPRTLGIGLRYSKTGRARLGAVLEPLLYRGPPLIRNHPTLRTYTRPMPRDLC